jgi:hypothetical protein
MGYYRLPNHRALTRSPSDPRCPVPTKEIAASPDAEVFIKNFRNRPTETVLVGTGDNFAPNYYSRVLKDEQQTAVTHPPGKELYQWDGTQWLWYEDVNSHSPATNADLQLGKSTIPADNVGCFLSYVHYDALVPGKHDFYYGPERLRQLARFMAGISNENVNKRDFAPVQMLAANLMIKTSWANDHAPIPDSGKPPFSFATKYWQVPLPPGSAASSYRNLEIADFTEGGFAFPWMRLVRVNAMGWEPRKLKASLRVYLCEAMPNDPDDFLNHGGFCKNQSQLSINEDATKEAEADSGPGSLVYDLPAGDPLNPGTNYAICIPAPEITVDQRHDADALHAKPYCFRFSIYNPFFQFPDWNRPDHSPASGYKNPGLWVVKEGGGRTSVVIFGVVDPQLQEHVGGDNFSWRTLRGNPGAETKHEKRYTTQLAIADPVRALIHLEDYFEEQYHRERNKEFQGIRVLLAHATRGREATCRAPSHLPAFRRDCIGGRRRTRYSQPNTAISSDQSGWESGVQGARGVVRFEDER